MAARVDVSVRLHRVKFEHSIIALCGVVLLVTVSFCLGVHSSFNDVNPRKLHEYRERVRRMFQHAYDGYVKYAYPYDELRPITCDGHDTWGSFSLTLIDALDTLAIMDNKTEFRKVAKMILDRGNFDKDVNVSVFETNIRVVGGLISGHLFTKSMGMDIDPGWPCTGPLLSLAEDVARRLLPAFNTATKMPYGTVNLRHGVPVGETPVTCTSCIGTFLVEFGALSRLTGDPVFEYTANEAMKTVWASRSDVGLVGNHINVVTGKWTDVDSGIGGGIDSYYEYLVKAAIMFQRTDLLEMFRAYEVALETHTKQDDWYLMAHMGKGHITRPLFQSLEAFWPGLQSLLGDIEKGMKTIHNYHQVWQQFGFTPELYNIPKSIAHPSREGYPLRPELVESAMYLYRATGDPYLLEIGYDVVDSIEHITKTSCGYATVKNVKTHSIENRMESFFLSETTKYLYLLFTPDHFIHNTGSHGSVIHTPHGQCVINAGGYMFNTEAHPIDIAALQCCGAQKKRNDAVLQDLHDNLDLLTLFGIVDPVYDKFAGVKLKDALNLNEKGWESDEDLSEDVLENDVLKRDVLESDVLDREVSESDFAESDVLKRDVLESDVLDSDVSGSDFAESEVSESDMSESDVSKSDVSKSDVLNSDVSESDVSENDVSKSGISENNWNISQVGNLTEYESGDVSNDATQPETNTVDTKLHGNGKHELSNKKVTDNNSRTEHDVASDQTSDDITARDLTKENSERLLNESMSDLLKAVKKSILGKLSETLSDKVMKRLAVKGASTTNDASNYLHLLGNKRNVGHNDFIMENEFRSSPMDVDFKAELLSCPAQPYHMKFSKMGEMFET